MIAAGPVCQVERAAVSTDNGQLVIAFWMHHGKAMNFVVPSDLAAYLTAALMLATDRVHPPHLNTEP